MYRTQRYYPHNTHTCNCPTSISAFMEGEFQPTPAISSVAYSPNGDLAAGLDNRRNVMIFNPDGTLRQTLNTDSFVTSVAYSPVDGSLAAGAMAGHVVIFNPDGTRRQTLQADSQVTSVAYSLDGDLAAGLFNGNVIVNGALRYTPPWEQFAVGKWVQSVAYNPVDGSLAAGVADGKVIILEPNGTSVLRTIPATLSSVAYSPNGDLAAGRYDGNVIVWSYDGIARTFETSRVSSVAYSPNGDLAAGLQNGNVIVWSYNGNLVTTFQTGSPVKSVAYSPNGDLAAGLRNGLMIWRWAERRKSARK